MKIECQKCQHTWEAEVGLGQRMIMCPKCSQLTPLELFTAAPAGEGAGEFTASYNFGEILSVPFAIDTAEDSEAPAVEYVPPASQFHMDDSRRGSDSGRQDVLAIVEVELANLEQLRESEGEKSAVQAFKLLKKAVRYETDKHAGREINATRRFQLAFPKSVDAVGFALSLMETMRRLSDEVGFAMAPRIGIHAGAVKIYKNKPERIKKGSPELEVGGAEGGHARALRRLALPRQVLLTRQAYSEAGAEARGNPSIPPSAQWIRHGRVRSDDIEAELEIFEVGRVGLAPLQSPVNPAGGKATPSFRGNGDGQETFTNAGDALKLAFQVGKAQLGESLSRKGGKAEKAGSKDEDLEGRVLGFYRVGAKVESTDTFVIHRARDIDHETDVLLKFLRREQAKDPEKLTRFAREGLTGRVLQHPNVLRAVDFGRHQGWNYVAYEFVHGTSLETLVRSSGPLRTRAAVGYMVQVARGLRVAQDAGLIHRNVQPANILVSEDGSVKLAGLSVAKFEESKKGEAREAITGSIPVLNAALDDVTVMDAALGIPSFIAPEQARDASSVDARADQFAFGATLYFLLTGKAPYSGSHPMEVLAKMTDAYEPVQQLADVPAPLARVIDQLLAMKPQERFENFAQIVWTLEEYLGLPHSPESSGGEMRRSTDAIGDVSRAGAPPKNDVFAREGALFYAARWAKVRKGATIAFVTLLPLAALASVIFLKNFQIAVALVALIFVSTAWNVLLDGIINKSDLYRRVKLVFTRMGPVGWVGTVFSGGAIVVVMWLVGSLLLFLATLVGGLLLALGYQFGVATPLRLERAACVHRAAEEVRNLRSLGTDEQRIHKLLFHSSVPQWEEFFEALFGYDAMLRARVRYTIQLEGFRRPRFARWRDPIAQWARTIEMGRERQREQEQLIHAEMERLKATGLTEPQAAKAARLGVQKQVHELRDRARSAQTPVSSSDAMPGSAAPVVAKKTAKSADGSLDPFGDAQRIGEGGGAGDGRFEKIVVEDPYAAASKGPLPQTLGLLCLGVGLFLVFGGIAVGFADSLPESLTGFFVSDFATWSTFTANWIYAVVGGIIIGQHVIPRSTVGPLFAFIGAFLVFATEPVVALVNQPQFTADVSAVLGFILIGISLLLDMVRTMMGPKGL